MGLFSDRTDGLFEENSPFSKDMNTGNLFNDKNRSLFIVFPPSTNLILPHSMGHRYNAFSFNHDFVNAASDVVERSVEDFRPTMPSAFSTSALSISAVLPSYTPDTVIDLRDIRDCYRFVLVIRNDNENSGKTTAICNGYILGGEEPYDRHEHINEDAYLQFTHVTVTSEIEEEGPLDRSTTARSVMYDGQVIPNGALQGLFSPYGEDRSTNSRDLYLVDPSTCQMNTATGEDQHLVVASQSLASFTSIGDPSIHMDTHYVRPADTVGEILKSVVSVRKQQNSSNSARRWGDSTQTRLGAFAQESFTDRLTMRMGRKANYSLKEAPNVNEVWSVSKLYQIYRPKFVQMPKKGIENFGGSDMCTSSHTHQYAQAISQIFPSLMVIHGISQFSFVIKTNRKRSSNKSGLFGESSRDDHDDDFHYTHAEFMYPMTEREEKLAITNVMTDFEAQFMDLMIETSGDFEMGARFNISDTSVIKLNLARSSVDPEPFVFATSLDGLFSPTFSDARGNADNSNQYASLIDAISGRFTDYEDETVPMTESQSSLLESMTTDRGSRRESLFGDAVGTSSRRDNSSLFNFD